MADAEEKAKAEKLAAAKKRVEALKKKNKEKKTTSKKTEKSESAAESSSKDAPENNPAKEEPPDIEEGDGESTEPKEDPREESKEETKDEPKEEEASEETISELKSSSRPRQPSISVQSKMRSSSFRQASAGGGPLSPDYGFSPEGSTAPDIYRKQASRIEELERENKRLAKEASDGEKRWKKAEEDLEDLREADDGPKTDATATPDPSGELEKLKAEKVALQRQLTQLQAQSTRGSRHGSSPSISVLPNSLAADLASKSATIETMEIEISNLRARLISSTTGPEKEQILALEDKLLRTERAAATSQRELQDLKKNLDRTTEKAVKDSSERISAETKLRTLTLEASEAKAHAEELQKKVDALEKKVATLTTLHKEHDSRLQTQKREREKAEKETSDLRAKQAGIENENLRLREERERARKREASGADDGVDELENEELQRLERKIRELEGENHELRRGVWKDRRGDINASPSGARFTDVDLGSTSPNRSRRRSTANKPGGGIGDFFTSGFNAITGATAPGTAGLGHGAGSGYNDSSAFMEDEDEFEEFDEDAFRLAQEEEMKKRIERVKEVKRGLKNWDGWRLDLVENRKGGGEGVGEIFEI